MKSNRAGPGAIYWTVAVLSLLWNAFGCFDFTMTVTRNAAYLANFPPDMIDWLDAAPAWMTVAWAAGVWGALAGSLAVLLRSRWAVPAFTLSLGGLAATTVYQIAGGVPGGMASPGAIAMTVVIWAIAVGLLWFAIRKSAQGVLR